MRLGELHEFHIGLHRVVAAPDAHIIEKIGHRRRAGKPILLHGIGQRGQRGGGRIGRPAVALNHVSERRKLRYRRANPVGDAPQVGKRSRGVPNKHFQPFAADQNANQRKRLGLDLAKELRRLLAARLHFLASGDAFAGGALDRGARLLLARLKAGGIQPEGDDKAINNRGHYASGFIAPTRSLCRSTESTSSSRYRSPRP